MLLEDTKHAGWVNPAMYNYNLKVYTNHLKETNICLLKTLIFKHSVIQREIFNKF